LSSKKIYIIRHGQTDFNLTGIVQGSGVDTSLNDQGRSQANAFFEMYKHVKFDKVYTSALKRTKETVQPFLSLGIKNEAFAGLNEISWGANEGRRITPEEDRYYHWMLEQWQHGNTSQRIDGGESPEDVALRQKPVLKYILSQQQEETILICMHGRAIRILLCNLLNYPLKSMDMFEHQNLCLYLLNCSGTMMTIEKHNDVQHLLAFADAAV
jgi:broad specificity phosphatase PhoE